MREGAPRQILTTLRPVVEGDNGIGSVSREERRRDHRRPVARSEECVPGLRRRANANDDALVREYGKVIALSRECGR